MKRMYNRGGEGPALSELQGRWARQGVRFADKELLMPRCPVCRSELPEGARYCPPRGDMVSEERGLLVHFGGCESIRIENIKHTGTSSGSRIGPMAKRIAADLRRAIEEGER